MSEQQKEDNQKTIVSFIVGLLIGGLLVWAFAGGDDQNNNQANDDNDADVELVDQNDNDEEEDNDVAGEETETDTNDDNDTAALPRGNGAVTLANNDADTVLELESATFPTEEGWVGVRELNNDEIGRILGVARYSEAQGLIPTQIVLQRPMTANSEYAVVFFNENGDRVFNSAVDTQLEEIAETFTAK